MLIIYSTKICKHVLSVMDLERICFFSLVAVLYTYFSEDKLTLPKTKLLFKGGPL